ncbi:MAG: hypothetical protein AMXMBFR64_61350 [Myxococcales bacterium]
MTDELTKRCPTCRATWPASKTTCPDDGAMLIYKLPEDPSLVGTVVDSRYKVERLLAEGGMGRVYLARQLSVDRAIALKVLLRSIASNVSAVQRFQNEARAASRLTSANTVTVFDFGQEPSGLLYIAMEYVEGRSLWRAIESDGPFPVDRAVGIACQVLESLSEAHAKSIIHRDIKPDNVLLTATATGDELAKVTDFGIAKVLSGEERTDLTTAGMVVGTPRYLSPEQIRGEPPDARSDLYSLGVVLYEMLAGVPPFEDKVPMNLLVKHLSEQPVLLHRVSPRVSGAVSAIVHRALAKEREARPESARAFRDALLQAVGATGPSIRVGAPSYEAVIAHEETGQHAVPAPPTPGRVTTSPYDEGNAATRAVDPTPAIENAPLTASAELPTVPSRRRAVLLGILLVAVVGAFAFAVAQLGEDQGPPAQVSGRPAGAQREPDLARGKSTTTPQVSVPVATAADAVDVLGAEPNETSETRGAAAAADAMTSADAAEVARATSDAAQAEGTERGAPAALDALAEGQPGEATPRTVRVLSDPPEAEVIVGGESLGKTPWDITLPGDDDLVVTLRRRGFEDTAHTLDATSGAEVTVALQRRKAKGAVRPTPGAAEPKPDKPPGLVVPYID